MDLVDTGAESGVPRRGLSRRTLVKGAAWSVPVLMMTTAAPAFAASSGGITPQPGNNCYQGGKSINAFRFYLLQPTLSGDSISITGQSLQTSSTVAGVGVTIGTVTQTSTTVGSITTLTFTFNITSDSTGAYPYLLISGTNTTGNTDRNLTVTQTRAGETSSWTDVFASNTENCTHFRQDPTAIAQAPALRMFVQESPTVTVPTSNPTPASSSPTSAPSSAGDTSSSSSTDSASSSSSETSSSSSEQSSTPSSDPTPTSSTAASTTN